jgi:uncharacterized membrane protein
MAQASKPEVRKVRRIRRVRRTVAAPAKKSGGLRKAGRIRTYFLTGVLVSAPFAITIYIAALVIDFVDARVTSVIPDRYNPNTYLPFGVPGLGLVVIFIILVVIGWVAAGYVGRIALRYGERIMANTPVLRTIYNAAKQILETVMSAQSSAFRQVVLVQYPHKGVWVLGFVTGDPGDEVQSHTKDQVVGVMVPTTPNPTSGFLLYVKASDVIMLDMTIEEAAKLVISAGLVAPEYPRKPVEISSRRQPARSNLTAASRENR